WRLGPDVADLGYSVVAPDLRGHGASPHGEDYRLESYRDDVLALGGDWDLVIGHSQGGAVATLCQLADSGFARRLVLLDPVVDIADPEDALEWLMEPFLVPITEAQIAAGHPRWHPEDVAFKVRALLATSPEVLEMTIRQNHRPFDGSITDLDVPTLLVGADPEVDALVSKERGEAMAAANPLVEYVIIPGAGHSLHRDDYLVLWAAIEPFIL
ncbi:MAG: alpha/beta fold hydrolase, partial [Acidimicrobiia bacterium]|nr:alpha/beta fold hydrolase [Acidimicrobiia bacterium]